MKQAWELQQEISGLKNDRAILGTICVFLLVALIWVCARG